MPIEVEIKLRNMYEYGYGYKHRCSEQKRERVGRSGTAGYRD